MCKIWFNLSVGRYIVFKMRCFSLASNWSAIVIAPSHKFQSTKTSENGFDYPGNDVFLSICPDFLGILCTPASLKTNICLFAAGRHTEMWKLNGCMTGRMPSTRMNILHQHQLKATNIYPLLTLWYRSEIVHNLPLKQKRGQANQFMEFVG